MFRLLFVSLVCVPLCLQLTVAVSSGEEPKLKPKQLEFFESKIRPVLIEHCYECHSQDAETVEGGLFLDHREGLLKGGESGPTIVAKDVAASLLIDSLKYESLEMPPSGQLPANVIADFVRWVNMGAPDPRNGSVQTVEKAYHTASAEELWSLQPLAEPPLPQGGPTEWSQTVIDRFIYRDLAANNLEPNELAQPAALLRRVSFDLIGLPPSPELLEKFLADPTPAHFNQIVDEYLASPDFGEKWGRHWLDVARFAESNGKDRDVLFPHAWRYRNYVIDSFNADKSYDQFLREQVAGDLLPADSDSHRDELVTATGFLAIGPKLLSRNGVGFEIEVVDEQIDVTSRAMFGFTVACARCHDHKFDPIPTSDYYAMAGIFRSTQTLYGARINGRGVTPTNPNLAIVGENSEQRWKNYVEQYQVIEELQKRKSELTKQRAKLLKGAKKDESKQQQAKELQQQIKQIDDQLKQAESELPIKPDFTMAVQDSNKFINQPLLIRGDLKKPGDPIPRGMISAVSLPEQIKVPADQGGRLELANWITHPDNPLTSRVAVNRIWHHLFGKGLVVTVDNFGSLGEQPSHPELLDFLSRSLIEQDWSVKSLVRQIVLSRTYQLSSDFDTENYEVDPDNRYLWRHATRRLDAEQIRDAILLAADDLIRERPEQSLVAQIGNGEVGRGIKEEILYQDYPYRSVYLPIVRSRLLEFLKLFDFPDPSMTLGNRDATTIPAQALYLMNSPFVIDQSEKLTRRVQSSAETDDARITYLYQLILSRSPDDQELTTIRGYLNSDRQIDEMDRDQLWNTLCQNLLSSAEFRYLP